MSQKFKVQMLWFLSCFIRCSWDDFYQDPVNPTQILQNSIYTNESKIASFKSSLYVYNSLFSNCYSSSYGGAIYYYYKNGVILIEYTTFDTCYASIYGGAVFANYNSDFVVNCVCSFNCFTKDYGQSIYTIHIVNKNYIYQSSICSNYVESEGSAPITLYNADQQCQSVNVSNYLVSSFSAILYQFGSISSLIEYCSVISNTAKDMQCLMLSNLGSWNYYEVNTCNIINNTQSESTLYGIISCAKDTGIKNCCILNNSGGNLFYTYDNATITIVNCTLPSYYGKTGTIKTNSAKPYSSFFNKLESTYCSIQTPSKTIQRTQRGPDIYHERKPILFQFF